MKVFPRSLLFVSLTLSLGLSATSAVAGDEWRAVTPEELAMKTGKVEPVADAEAICWEIRIDDSSAGPL